MGPLWKRVALAWLRRAADPFFGVKMRVNELVLSEVTKALYPNVSSSELTDVHNKVAVAMLDSDIHVQIDAFARSVVNEIRKQQQSQPK